MAQIKVLSDTVFEVHLTHEEANGPKNTDDLMWDAAQKVLQGHVSLEVTKFTSCSR